MRQRNLVLCLSGVLLLLVAIVVAVYFLYVPSESAEGADVVRAEAVDSVNMSKDTTARPAVPPAADETVSADTPAAPKVPQGPTPVKNSATGLMCKLVQNEDCSLSFFDHKDVLQWQIPFPGPLCGRVQTVDYFANGKLQYLMITGDELYLVDRLGRTVKGFPVKLQKTVSVGPDVYDFRHIKKYNIIVLNADNTIDMYNLAGEKPAAWETIAVQEDPLALPEYFEIGSKSYWTVPTATQNRVYSFYGQHVKTFDGEVDKTKLD